ncbi:zinc finger protein, partial [Loa loa]
INPKKIWLKNHQHEISSTQTIKREHPEHAIHIDEKRFKSEISKEDFVAPSSSHMKIHSGRRSFSCSECAANFTTSGNLRRHMMIHTGKKPFFCSECTANFTRSDNLDGHMIIHSCKRPLSGIHNEFHPGR